MTNRLGTAFATAIISITVSSTAHAGYVLQLPLGPGNDGAGVAIVEVDGFGSYGSAIDAGQNGGGDLPGPATFEPQGAPRADAVVLSVGAYSANGGNRQVRTSGNFFGLGNEPAPAISDENGTAVSNFTVSAAGGAEVFNVELRQSIEELTDSNGMRSGSELVQTYAFTNLTGSDATLDIGRYIDGNLLFDNSSDDGGGYLSIDGEDFVFITDTDDTQQGSIATTFVGLTSESPSMKLDDGYEVAGAPFSLFNRIRGDQQLIDAVVDDVNNDNFVDADAGSTNITIGMTSLFNVLANGTLAYTERTIFGFGAPQDVRNGPVPEPDPVPAPASLLLIGTGLLLGWRKRRNLTVK